MKIKYLLFILIISVSCKEQNTFFKKEILPKANELIDKMAPPADDKEVTYNCLENPSKCDKIIPYVKKAGVVTILLALGDQVKDQLVINNLSSQLIIHDMVKYASPKVSPKILVVLDSKNAGESSGDTAYIVNILSEKYDVQRIDEPKSGLTENDLDGYDVIWFNNPGHPMGLKVSLDTLEKFKGGIVISGDDLTRGSNFDMSSLTGLKYLNNGTSAKCNGETIRIDNNNSPNKYYISLDKSIFPAVGEATLSFQYGNDIDESSLIPELENNLEVLAYATAGENCLEKRPVVVRYEK